MSYHIYTTDGIVLKRTAFGEANVLLHILTKDLGLIMASARSVRLDSSKLRSALQEYSLVTVSCIKGKNGWKITNAVEASNFYFDQQNTTHAVLAQVAVVLLKMIPGESVHPEIFGIVKSGFEFLLTLEQNMIKSFEVLIVLRILYHLGYVSNQGFLDLLQNEEEWDLDLINKVLENKISLVALINNALKESQL